MPNPQLDYLLDMSQRDYPFASRHTDPEINQVFADLYIIHSYSGSNAANLTLDSIEFSSSTDINFVIKDGATVLLDSSDGDVVRSVNDVWGGRYRAFEYYNPENSVHVKIILDDDVLTPLIGESYSSMNLKILNRNVEFRALRVNSLAIPLYSPITGDIRLLCGNNIKMTVGTTDSEIRPATTITIDAIPGEGSGNYKPDDTDCAAAATTLKTINGVSPNTYGNFLIGSSDCIWLTSDTAHNELRLHNDCRLCYDCTDVFGSYQNLYDLNTYAINLRKRIADLCTVYSNKLVDLKKFRDSLNIPGVIHWFTQTDYEAYDFRFRVQCGGKAVKLVVITAAYAAVDGSYTITPLISPFSGYYKLPTFSAQPIVGFTGTSATYDSTASPATTKLQPGTYGYWYWNMQFFSSSIAETEVKVTWSVSLTFTDDTTYNTGSIETIINIVPQGGSS